MSGRVVHCKREAFDVYIGRGRGGVWGNPFVMESEADRADVIAKYDAWLSEQPDLLRRLPELAGKVLGCWCAPKTCHGDVLVRRSAVYMHACPDCGAQPGAACVGADGAVQDWAHEGRLECAGLVDAVDAELRGEKTYAASPELIGDVAARRLF